MESVISVAERKSAERAYLTLCAALALGYQVCPPVSAGQVWNAGAFAGLVFDFVLEHEEATAPLALRVQESDAVWQLLAERRWPIRKICSRTARRRMQG